MRKIGVGTLGKIGHIQTNYICETSGALNSTPILLQFVSIVANLQPYKWLKFEKIWFMESRSFGSY